MSQRKLTSVEVQFLQEALSSDYKTCGIRLREGEHQYALAKTMAAFQLELFFPNVKDLTKRLFSEEETNDVQFTRKIQTILKKMEKSNVVRILPKKKPWELQRYALLSFKFRDVDKNVVALAMETELSQSENLLHAMVNQQGARVPALINSGVRVLVLAVVVLLSYVAVLWDFLQPMIDPAVFVLALSVAVISSVALGRALA